MVRFVVVLAVVCIIAAFILGSTNSITKPLIAAQKEKQQNEALANVLPGADKYQKQTLNGKEYYEAYKDTKLIGYALFVTGQGYSDDIDMLIGIDRSGNISGVEVLSQEETPGLGARCVEVKPGENQPWFLKQFKGKSAKEISLKNINGITGATITSEAIIKAIREQATDFLGKVKK